MPSCKLFNRILVAFTRFVGLGFVVVAGYSIPEALKLLGDSYEQSGSTLFVPLLICEPVRIFSASFSDRCSHNTYPHLLTLACFAVLSQSEIQIEGSTLVFNSTEVSDAGSCHNLQYLVQLVISSLALSIAAMVVFFIFDFFASRKIGPFGKSSVLGMGLFLIFILVQSAICTYALASECLFWTKYFTQIYSASGYDDAYGINSIRTYGNSTLLFATGGIAVLASFLLLLEAVAKACLKEGKDFEENSMVNGVPKRLSSKQSSKALDSEQLDETTSTIDPPTLEEGPSPSIRLDGEGRPNADMPSWLTGDN